MPIWGLFSPNIEKLKAKHDVKALIKALDKRLDSKVRQAAAEALGELRDIQGIAPLLTLLDSWDEALCNAVVNALGNIGVPATEPLTKCLMDRSLRVRKAAVRALDQVGWQPDRSENAAWYWITRQNFEKCVEIGQPALGPLYEQIGYGWSEAIRAIGEIGSEDDIRRLRKFLEGDPKYEPIKVAAIEAIVNIGARIGEKDERVRNRIFAEAFKDRYGNIREEAVVALGKIGIPAIEWLTRAALDSSNQNLQIKAIEELTKIGVPAIESLRKALKDSSLRVRKAAARALDRLGWQPRSDDVWYWLAQGNFEKCAEIGIPAIEPLIVAIQNDERQGAATALIKIGAPALEMLMLKLVCWTSWKREATVEALKAAGWHPKDKELYLILHEWDKIPHTPEMARPLLSLFSTIGIEAEDRRDAGRVLLYILEKHAKKLESDILHDMADLDDVIGYEKYDYSDFETKHREYTIANHQPIRELAKQEIGRRSKVN
jgi:HEAT repeat protein